MPWERPPIADGSQARPAPMPLTLTVTVTGLSPGADYSLFMFDDVETAPTHDFATAGLARAAKTWRFRGGESGAPGGERGARTQSKM